MSSPSRSCLRCGRGVRATARFCANCGARLNGDTIAANTTAPPDATLAVTVSSPSDTGDTLVFSSALEPDTTLGVGGRYRIRRMLARGGFGAAYLAHDTQLMRSCVVKQLLLDPRWSASQREQALASFQREARLLVSLNSPGHPSIPEIYDYLAESQCVVMKYVEGEDLRAVARRQGGKLPQTDALRYARDVCAALVYMHGHTPEPVLHRDIKPANILLDSAGRIWLIDFGLSKSVPAPLLARAADHSQRGGTLGFAPPEQWRGGSEPRSDIYALAATLHALLTGYNPSADSDDIAALLRGEQRDLPPARQINPAVRADVEALLKQALARSVEARPSAATLLAALDTVIRRAAAPLPPEPARPPVERAFVGRTAEMARIGDALDQRLPVLITGMPGIGKTTLAAAAARRAANPQTIFWHAFHQGEGVDTLIWALAAALAHQGHDALWSQLQSGREAGAQPPASILLGYLVGTLRDKGLLLCFDDLHLAADDPLLAQLFTQLLAPETRGELQILATAQRAPDWMRGAERIALVGLSLADTADLLATNTVLLAPEPTARLHAATGGSPQFVLLGGYALARATDPLRAIERLVAADDIERYLISQVDDRLGERERATMGAVAVLLDYGGTADAIEAVLGTGARRPLSDLSGRALLNIAENADGREYSLNGVLQVFYYDMLNKSERRAMHLRAAEHYAAAPDPLAAARHFERAGAIERAADLAITHAVAIINGGRAQALLSQIERFEAATLDAERRVALDLVAGQGALLLANYDRAQRHYRRALDLLQALPPERSTVDHQATACRWLARLHEQRGDYRQALEWVGQGLALLAGRDTSETADLLLIAGLIYTRQGDYGAALERCRRSLAIAEALGVELVLARGYNLLGHIARRSENAAAAVAYFQQSFARYQQAGDLHGQALLHNQIANAYDDLGHWVEASQHYSQARMIFDQLGDAYRRALADSNQGTIAVSQGHLDDALALLHTARATLVQLDASPYAQGIIELNLGAAYVRQGDAAEARQHLEASRTLFAQAQSAEFLPELARHQAEAARCDGDLATAETFARQALELARADGAQSEAARAQRVLGEIALEREQLDQAQAFLEESCAALDALSERYAAAQSRLALARLCVAQGRGAEAQSALSQCVPVFEQLDARVDLDQARALEARLALQPN